MVPLPDGIVEVSSEAAIDEALQEMKSRISSQNTFVAVAGTAVTLAMVQLGLREFDRNKIDGMATVFGNRHFHLATKDPHELFPIFPQIEFVPATVRVSKGATQGCRMQPGLALGGLRLRRDPLDVEQFQAVAVFRIDPGIAG